MHPINKIPIITAAALLSLSLQLQCSGSGGSSSAVTYPAGHVTPGSFAKGADVGWLQQMEATGYTFYDDSGRQKDCLAILKEHGIDSIRLRVWVNPSADKADGHCSPAEVTVMAKRVHDAGFRLMIDFHYSDSWADFRNQYKPAAWTSHSFTQLKKDVYDHTYTVMGMLAENGVYPEWVQVGNEINPGMLLPDGSTSDYAKLGALINEGYAAVKKISPESAVIIHLASGADNSVFRSFFDGLTAAKTDYDVIGMSYYPSWNGGRNADAIGALAFNLNDMSKRYGKKVMIVEVGGTDTDVQGTADTLLSVMDRVNTVPGSKGLGVFYWEPEGAKSWSGYALSAWGSNGRPTAALDAFLSVPQKLAENTTADGSVVTIYSNAQKAFVAADGAGALAASAVTVTNDAARFSLWGNGDGSVSLKSVSKGLFVTAANTTGQLIADGVSAGSSQKFKLLVRSDGFQALQAVGTGMHWDADDDKTIHAQWSDLNGGWQSFSVFTAGN